MLSEKVFYEGMTIFLATFQRVKLIEKGVMHFNEKSEMILRTWYKLLEDMDDKKFMQNVMDVCQNERNIYPGTNIVTLLRCGTQSTIQDEALGAWLQVKRVLLRADPGDKITFADPIIPQTIKYIGGLSMLRHAGEDNHRVQALFERVYIFLKTGKEKLKLKELDIKPRLEDGGEKNNEKNYTHGMQRVRDIVERLQFPSQRKE